MADGRRAVIFHLTSDIRFRAFRPSRSMKNMITDPFPAFESPVGPVDQPKIVGEYFKHVAAERRRRLKGKVMPALDGVGLVFPNFTCHPQGFPRELCVWQPLTARLTEGWRLLLVERDAPKEVKDLLRHHYIRYSGPSGMTEQDDMENWNYATEASAGTIARRAPPQQSASSR